MLIKPFKYKLLAIPVLLAVIATSFATNIQTVDSHNETVAQSEAVVVVEPKTLFTADELQTLVFAQATKYGANPSEVFRTVKCEAKQRMIDGVIYYDAAAKSDYPEESYGLAQWNLPAGNTNHEGTRVTHAQATDAEYSVGLMAHYFSQGKKGKWSCYRKLYA